MLRYISHRVLMMIPMLIGISLVSFLVIELPPGDFVSYRIAIMESGGASVEQATIDALRNQYGLDLPLYRRYLRWAGNVLRGDFGLSFTYNKPVKELIWERLALTVVISLTTLLFTWVIGFFVGIYSATHQYSLGDYAFTAMSFVGVGIPDFLIAIVILWFGYSWFGVSLSGLFSQEFASAPWSWAKFLDMLKHLWLPLLVLGVGGTAGMIRTMRANVLDELHKPYVITARAKGLKETRLLLKYPVRVALNPFVSSIAWALPRLISGATIISVVMSLPTTGPLLLGALRAQDMYLASTFLLLLSVLTLIGTLISDILLAWLDPRIVYGE
ncbi:MAG: ABC transporter permease [Chloroflexi bacterium]|nr:ABC transporter permease [Chloroflexota bacterium]